MSLFDPDAPSPKNVNLKALCIVSIGGEEFDSGDTFRCNPEEALKHIEESRVELAEVQDHPPSHILQRLERKLEDFDDIGPEWCDGTRLQKFQDGVITGGTRRAMIEGKQLDWIEGIPNLRKVFRTAFKIGETPFGSILNQVEECWSHRKSRSYEHTVTTKLNEEEMLEQGIVCIKRRKYNMLPDVPSGGYYLFHVGQDWVQFYLKLQNIENKLKQNLMECLCTGRVLSVGEKSFGATLVLPSYWNDNHLINPKEGELMFVFSRDLPATWSHSFGALPSQKSKAIKWLEAAEKKLDAKAVKASQSDYTNIIMRKFDLSMNAANDVWKQAGRIYKGVSGNIPKSQKATKADLLEIENDN